MADYWFRADLRFLCPSCKKESVETIIAASENKHDPGAVATGVRDLIHPVVCQNCKAICPDGIQINLGINDLTPEELAKINIVGRPPRRLM
jgi:hypothetical protein